jgi:plastocyanin
MIHDLTRVPSPRVRAILSIPSLCIAVAFCIALASCGDDSPTDGGDDGTFTGTIHIRDFSFSPRNVTISVGDSVTWRWEGSNSHSVTNGTDPATGGNLFDHGPKQTGTFGYRFNNSGSFPYFCRPHFSMGMTGTITVQP